MMILRNYIRLGSLAAVISLLTVGCADSTTYLKNEKTGQIVKCGGAHAVTLAESAIQAREAECIEDYKQQGYVRVPGPN